MKSRHKADLRLINPYILFSFSRTTKTLWANTWRKLSLSRGLLIAMRYCKRHRKLTIKILFNKSWGHKLWSQVDRKKATCKIFIYSCSMYVYCVLRPLSVAFFIPRIRVDIECILCTMYLANANQNEILCQNKMRKFNTWAQGANNVLPCKMRIYFKSVAEFGTFAPSKPLGYRRSLMSE